MNIEYGGRASGRTTRMIDALLRTPNGVMVCISEQEAHRIRRIILERFKDTPLVRTWYEERINEMVITPSSVRSGRYYNSWPHYLTRHHTAHVFIDNVDMMKDGDVMLVESLPWSTVDYATAWDGTIRDGQHWLTVPDEYRRYAWPSSIWT